MNQLVIQLTNGILINITNEVVEAEWNKFYDYYNDVDGLFYGLEDENGYLI